MLFKIFVYMIGATLAGVAYARQATYDFGNFPKDFKDAVQPGAGCVLVIQPEGDFSWETVRDSKKVFPFCAPDAKDPVEGKERAKGGDLKDVELLTSFEPKWGSTEPVAVLEIWPTKNKDLVRGTRVFKYEKGEKKLMEPKDVVRPCPGLYTFGATCPETHWDGQVFLHSSPYTRPPGPVDFVYALD